jgi:acetyl-CoA carboxylase biotin carboxyl carrier protein
VSGVPSVPPRREPAAQLAEVGGQVVELLTRLDRPPRSLRLEVGEVRLDLEWQTDPVPAATEVRPAAPSPVPATGPVGEHLRSPAVGVFYHAKEPGARPFVSVGDMVEPNQQIGIIEAMKLMMPVEADRSGRVTAVLKGNGEPVEFDEPLFAIEAGTP